MTASAWPKYYLLVGRVGGPPSSTWTWTPTTHAAGGRCAGRGITPEDRQARHRVQRPTEPPPVRGGGSLAWLVGCPRVQVRDQRHADILLGFVHLACALSCHKSLNRVPV